MPRHANTERNARVVSSIRAGASFLQAAKAHGLSRSAVAGIWHRAGGSVSELERRERIARNQRPRTPEGEERRKAAVRAWWSTPENRARFQQIMREVHKCRASNRGGAKDHLSAANPNPN